MRNKNMRNKNRESHLKELGFIKTNHGWVKNTYFVITKSTIHNFNNEQWANLIAPFSDKT